MSQLLPTTPAQVSGHRFLVRRVEHGLVLGDIRMIHDPLAARRRALIFGMIGVVLVAAGSGLLAWMAPQPQPGQAPIVRAAQGQLFAQVDGTYHPVPNLASARLITGEPAQPVAIGTEALAQVPLGPPIGISDAPGVFAPPALAAAPADAPAASAAAPPGVIGWWACIGKPAIEQEQVGFDTTLASPQADQTAAGPVITVLAQELAQPVAPDTAALVTSEGREWLVSQQGRALLPEDNAVFARAIRRGLGIGPDTPRWEVSPEWLNTVPERAAVVVPDPLPTVVEASGDVPMWWAKHGSEIREITATQAQVLQAAGAQHDLAAPAQLASLRDAPPAKAPSSTPDRFTGTLPLVAPQFIDPQDTWLCGNGEQAATHERTDAVVDVPGTSPAAAFRGLRQGAVGVNSGDGIWVVAPTGARHRVDEAQALAALGIGKPGEAAWSVVRLLPEASPLSREGALRPIFSGGEDAAAG